MPARRSPAVARRLLFADQDGERERVGQRERTRLSCGEFSVEELAALDTATIASQFVKTDRADEHAGIAAALARIEADLAELKARLD